MAPQRNPYPSDVTDDEWAFCAPYLTLMKEEAPQREHPLREVFNGLRWMVRSGAPWRRIPNDLPPWHAIHQQAMRWIKAGCFEAMAHDLRAIVRLALGRPEDPTAAIFDSRTLPSTPESGERAGDDGYKRRKGSKVPIAVDTLGHLLALKVTPASEQDRAQVGELTKAMQEATHENVEVAFVDQGYPGQNPADEAGAHGGGWKWSSSQKLNAASSFCPAAGWLRDPLAGPRAFAASPVTTSASHLRCPDFTGSPS